jgi:hypothetical protein
MAKSRLSFPMYVTHRDHLVDLENAVEMWVMLVTPMCCRIGL